MGHEQPLRYPLKGIRHGRALVLGLVGRLRSAVRHLLDYGVRYFELSWTPEFVRFAGNSGYLGAGPAGHGHRPAARLLPPPRWRSQEPAAAAHRRHGLRHAGYRARHRRAGAHGPRFCLNDLAELAGAQGPGCC
jgi:hypothetical protein